MGAPVDEEDLTDKILDKLGNDYKELVTVVHARDTSITFDELHEKLLNFEASLPSTQDPEPPQFPATTNPTMKPTKNSRPNPTQ